jgi:hypothetical protein
MSPSKTRTLEGHDASIRRLFPSRTVPLAPMTFRVTADRMHRAWKEAITCWHSDPVEAMPAMHNNI